MDQIKTTQASYLLDLLRLSINGKTAIKFRPERVDWDFLMEMASIHGVLAIVWDGICKLPVDAQPNRRVRINWGLSAQEIWDRYNGHKKVLREIISLCKVNNIRVLLLKGLCLSNLYPNPHSRPSGDIDIFLFGDYEKGNSLLSKDDYKESPKHADFQFKGVVIENHRDFLDLNSTRQIEINNYLLNNIDKAILTDEGYYEMDASSSLLFLLMHTANHLQSQEPVPLTIRAIVDFALFLKSNEAFLTPTICKKLTEQFHVNELFELMVRLGEWVLGINMTHYYSRSIQSEKLFSKVKDLLLNPFYGKVDFSEYTFFQQFKIRNTLYHQLKWRNNFSMGINIRKRDFHSHVQLQLHVLIKRLFGYPESVPFFDSFRLRRE